MGVTKVETTSCSATNGSNIHTSGDRLQHLLEAHSTTQISPSFSSRTSFVASTELNSSNDSSILNNNNNITAESSISILPKARAPQLPRKSTSYHHPAHHVTETTYISLEYDPVKKRKILNSYEILRDLGEGQHGKVKLALDLRNGEKVAVKILDRGFHNGRISSAAANSSALWSNYNDNHYSEDLLNPSTNEHLYKPTQDENSLFSYSIKHKRSRSASENELKISKEIEIMKKCNHENVVKLWEVIDDRRLRKIYLVLEYLEKGEIKWQVEDELLSKATQNNQDLAIDVKHKPALSFKEARKIFRDVILGLEYLHHQGIIHRDIKPSNLLRSKDGVVKISDFGVAFLNYLGSPSLGRYSFNNNNEKEDEALMQFRKEQDLCTTAGTPAFYAPELCSAEQLFPICHKLDIWSTGVTLYCLMFGELPFNGKNNFELFENINNSQINILSYESFQAFNVKDNDNITEYEYNEFIDLLSRLLLRDPTSRIDIPEIKKHPFVLKALDSDEEKFRFDNNILIHCGSKSTNICEETIEEDSVEEPANKELQQQTSKRMQGRSCENLLTERMTTGMAKLNFTDIDLASMNDCLHEEEMCLKSDLPDSTIKGIHSTHSPKGYTRAQLVDDANITHDETSIFETSEILGKLWNANMNGLNFAENKKDSMVSLPVNSSYASLNSFDDNLIYEGVSGEQNGNVAGQSFPKIGLRDIECSSNEKVYIPRMSRILDDHIISGNVSSDDEESSDGDEGELILNFGTRSL